MRLVFGTAAFAACALLGWLAAADWFTPALGIPSTTPQAVLACFILALPPFLTLLGPIGSAWSRRDEFAADAYAVAHADGRALASALVTLYRENASTLTPDPWYVAFHYSHPPAAQRIARLPQ
jgi:STE24 endopeptidase